MNKEKEKIEVWRKKREKYGARKDRSSGERKEKYGDR